MERRSFIQTLAGAGIAVPLSQYLAIARPIDPTEAMLIEVPLGLGDQIMMIFPDGNFAAWFLLCLKPTGQRIKLCPNAHFRKFWVYTQPIFSGTTKDEHGGSWATYKPGGMVFAFQYYSNLIRTRRIGESDPARFRVGSIDPWSAVKGLSGHDIAWGDDKTLLATPNNDVEGIDWKRGKRLLDGV